MTLHYEKPQELCREDLDDPDLTQHKALSRRPLAASSPPRTRRILNEAAHKLPSSLLTLMYRGQQAAHPRPGEGRR